MAASRRSIAKKEEEGAAELLWPWITRDQAVQLTGYVERHFDKFIRPRLPAAAIKGNRVNLRFDAPAVCEALASYRVELQKPDESSKDDSVRRIKSADAAMSELKLAEYEGRLIDGDLFRKSMLAGFRVLRGSGEILVRRFGNEAAEIYNEGLDEFAAATTKAMSSNAPDHPAEKKHTPRSPVDAGVG